MRMGKKNMKIHLSLEREKVEWYKGILGLPRETEQGALLLGI